MGVFKRPPPYGDGAGAGSVRAGHESRGCRYKRRGGHHGGGCEDGEGLYRYNETLGFYFKKVWIKQSLCYINAILNMTLWFNVNLVNLS